MFDHGHFAENFPGAKLGKDAPGVGADEAGNLHQPVLDKIDAIAGIGFMENFGQPAAKCRSWAIIRNACNSLRPRLRNKAMDSSAATSHTFM